MKRETMTPSKSGSGRRVNPMKSIAKKAKQGSSIRRFCMPQDETPVLFPKRTGRETSWSSGVRRLERLGLKDSEQVEAPRRSAVSYPGAMGGPSTSAFAASSAVAPVVAALAAVSPGAGTGSITDEFFISSTQDYERGSQAFGTPDAALMPCMSQEPSFRFQSQVSISEEYGYFSSGGTLLQIQTARDPRPADEPEQHDDEEVPSTQTDLGGAGAAAGQTAGDAHATTPDLGLFSNTDELAQLAKPLFNIFLPKAEQRHLIIIRHGESEFNRAMEFGSGFKDPMIFDPPLTSKGREQARSLQEKLRAELSVHGDALWVISPLRRAIETFLLACPLVLGEGRGAAASSAHGGASTSSAHRAGGPQPALEAAGFDFGMVPRQSPGAGPSAMMVSPRPGDSGDAGNGGAGAFTALASDVLGGAAVEVMPLISEFLVTAGDVGSCASRLGRDFPSLSDHFVKLPEAWWFQEPRKPNCADAKTINSREPRAHQKKRVGELARWLSRRPEKFIIMIGHCSFWKEFSKTPEPMKNGEMRHMRW